MPFASQRALREGSLVWAGACGQPHVDSLRGRLPAGASGKHLSPVSHNISRLAQCPPLPGGCFSRCEGPHFGTECRVRCRGRCVKGLSCGQVHVDSLVHSNGISEELMDTPIGGWNASTTLAVTGDGRGPYDSSATRGYREEQSWGASGAVNTGLDPRQGYRGIQRVRPRPRPNPSVV
ncbi:hypothetical protein T484DRAFT_3212241 [Baffinella frigidus]|nr:hypothetical protein T484DRAFT_3212241 [Cryptophyta sp. CCMP2293]